jgi:hypothetical protein
MLEADPLESEPDVRRQGQPGFSGDGSRGRDCHEPDARSLGWRGCCEEAPDLRPGHAATLPIAFPSCAKGFRVRA